jgi:hypothetical protein
MLFLHSAFNIHPHAGAFVIAAGALLGVCAGLLWTAQGSLMLAYPTGPSDVTPEVLSNFANDLVCMIESQKGMFIAIFWGIFNLGGVVGAAVAVGQNFHSKASLELIS